MSAARHAWQGWHGWWRVLVTACLAFAIVAGVSAQSAQEDVRLVSAVQEQNTARIQQLLNEGVDVTAARADGVTALLWAAHWDDQASASGGPMGRSGTLPGISIASTSTRHSSPEKPASFSYAYPQEHSPPVRSWRESTW